MQTNCGNEPPRRDGVSLSRRSFWKVLYASIALGMVLLSAVIVRIPYLATRSVWYDEASSWQMSQFSLPELWYACQLNVHPPLYYLVLKAWSFVWGDSPVALRSLSIACSALAIVGIFTIGWLSGGGNGVKDARDFDNGKLYVAIVAATLMAVNAFQVNAGIEARMYALGTAFAVWSVVATIRVFRSNSTLWWIVLAFLLLSCTYTHHYCLLVAASEVAVLAVYGLMRWLRHSDHSVIRRLGGLVTGVGFGFLPGVLLLHIQLQRVRENYWTVPLGKDVIVKTFSQFWQPIEPANAYESGLCVFVVLLLCTALTIRHRSIEKCLVSCCAWLPIVLAGIVSSLVTPIWEGRFFRFNEPFFLVVIPLGLQQISQRQTLRWGFAAIVVAVVSYGTWVFWNARQVEQRGGMRAATEFVLQNSRPCELVLATSNIHYFPAKYYLRGQREIKLLRDAVREFWGHHLIRPRDLIGLAQLERFRERGIWLLGHSSRPREIAWTDDGQDHREIFHYDFGVPQWTVYVIHIQGRVASSENKQGNK
ncbi:MAG: hypothetical protein QXZ09_01150 [Candidatus Methanomethylicaceae archaeon]